MIKRIKKFLHRYALEIIIATAILVYSVTMINSLAFGWEASDTEVAAICMEQAIDDNLFYNDDPLFDNVIDLTSWVYDECTEELNSIPNSEYFAFGFVSQRLYVYYIIMAKRALECEEEASKKSNILKVTVQ